MVKRYDSWSDFIAQCDTPSVRNTKYCKEISQRPEWYGYVQFDQALSLARSGDESLVSRAEALLDKLESVENGVPTREWSASPYGAYPCVPDYLAGFPDSMRVLAPMGDVAPIGIYTSTSSQETVTADEILQRGIAIIALVLKLQQIRPVELYLTAELDGYGGYGDGSFQVIPIDSKPLSIAHACFGLTSVGFARRLTYGYAKAHMGFTGGWPNGFRQSNYDEIARQALGLSPDDLHIGSITSYDPLIHEPVKWVNEQIARYSAQHPI